MNITHPECKKCMWFDDECLNKATCTEGDKFRPRVQPCKKCKGAGKNSGQIICDACNGTGVDLE